ncbi:MAG: flagellar biosynthesis protein FlhB [Alphaproteobacteria bacterium]|nr:MAG: flagellar biosynthesis protein FlhB [Alphaproteobacteria bacterium]
MAEDQTDDSQKTEDPTPKKLEESRKRGQIAMSREVNNWVMLFAGTIFIVALVGPMMSQLASMLRVYIEFSHALPALPGGLGVVLGEGVKKVMGILLLPLLLFMFAAFAAPFLQIGPLFAPEVIKPDWSKVSIKKGLGRLFSMRSVVELLKGVVKIGVIGMIATIIIYPYFYGFEHFVNISIGAVMIELRALVIKMMVGVLIVLMVIAMMDLLYQRYEYNKKMRMSRQEIKDEYKQSEGDPHVKAKLRQLRAQKAQQRMMQAVPSADVIITNPTHYSIALKYDPDEMPAPIVIAMGMDETALRIREVAKEHDIILYENKPLARALYDVAVIDEMIPMEHFKAVAEIISYVFKLKGRLN